MLPAVAIGLAVLLFGASVPASKALLSGIDPWLLAGLLYLGSGIGLTILRLAGGRFGFLPREAGLRRADLPVLAGAVVAGGIVAPVLLMMGLRATPAADASLLLNLETVATLAIAWAGGHEAPTRTIVLGAGLILAGSVLLSFKPGLAGFGWGGAAIAGACLGWAIDNNLTGRLSRADPVQIALIKGLSAGSVNLGLALTRHVAWPDLAHLGAAAGVGFTGYGLGLVLFIIAIRHLGVARASAYFACAPFVGTLLSVAFLGEPVTWVLLGGGALMAAGVWLHIAEQHTHEHAHEAMDHTHAHVHDLHHQHVHGPNDPPGEPHVHAHHHAPMVHAHRHFPDLHHRHQHRGHQHRGQQHRGQQA